MYFVQFHTGTKDLIIFEGKFCKVCFYQSRPFVQFDQFIWRQKNSGRFSTGY